MGIEQPLQRRTLMAYDYSQVYTSYKVQVIRLRLRIVSGWITRYTYPGKTGKFHFTQVSILTHTVVLVGMKTVARMTFAPVTTFSILTPVFTAAVVH